MLVGRAQIRRSITRIQHLHWPGRGSSWSLMGGGGGVGGDYHEKEINVVCIWNVSPHEPQL